MELLVYSTRDLYMMRSIVVQALEDTLPLPMVLAAIDQRLSELDSGKHKYPSEPMIDNVCPSCGAGRMLVRHAADCTYIICVNRTTGKAGCGWSRMI